jgi:hypothetical protein
MAASSGDILKRRNRKMDQPLALSYAYAGFLAWDTGYGTQAYGFRFCRTVYLVTGKAERKPPQQWDEPVVLRCSSDDNPGDAWEREFSSSREFLSYWEKEAPS